MTIQGDVQPLRPYQLSRVPCEICGKNYYDYVAFIIYEGVRAMKGHPICSACIAEHLIDVLGEYKAFLSCFSLPVTFDIMWDTGDNTWVPATRKGPLWQST